MQARPSTRPAAQGRVEVYARFIDRRRAARAIDVLRRSGYAVALVEIEEEPSAEPSEGVAVVRVGWAAWVGLVVGAALGLGLGLALWSGQIVLGTLAPALSSGRAAVPTLVAGILAAVGWLVGALIPLARERSMSAILVDAPMDRTGEIERRLVELGAERVVGWSVKSDHV